MAAVHGRVRAVHRGDSRSVAAAPRRHKAIRSLLMARARPSGAAVAGRARCGGLRPRGAVGRGANRRRSTRGIGRRARGVDDPRLLRAAPRAPLARAPPLRRVTLRRRGQPFGRSQTRALHALNPSFLALQYRLALGLGYRATDARCRARGDWLRVRFGDDWVREWPTRVPSRWLFRLGGSRVFSCWGWYVVDPDDASWRAYYLAQLRREVATTDADGAFLDSARAPASIGRPFRPELPAAETFTAAWNRRLKRLLRFVRRGLGRPVFANAGSLLATHFPAYSDVDGVMVEPFALDHEGGNLPCRRGGASSAGCSDSSAQACR